MCPEDETCVPLPLRVNNLPRQLKRKQCSVVNECTNSPKRKRVEHNTTKCNNKNNTVSQSNKYEVLQHSSKKVTSCSTKIHSRDDGKEQIAETSCTSNQNTGGNIKNIQQLSSVDSQNSTDGNHRHNTNQEKVYIDIFQKSVMKGQLFICTSCNQT